MRDMERQRAVCLIGNWDYVTTETAIQSHQRGRENVWKRAGQQNKEEGGRERWMGRGRDGWVEGGIDG